MNSNFQHLNKRVDQIETAQHTTNGQYIKEFISAPKRELFPPDERPRFEAFLAEIEPKLVRIQGQITRKLSEQEYQTFVHWLELYEALEGDNQAEAKKLRRWLSRDYEEVLYLFQAINPEQLTGLSHYPLSIGGYRNISRKVENDRVANSCHFC